MKIKYNDTEFKVSMKITANDYGLTKDNWVLVHMIVKNKEFEYEVERESLTKNEVNEKLKMIKEFYYNDKSFKEITFIKNYITMLLKKNKNDKYLKLNLISLENRVDENYSIIFKNEEILDFIKETEYNKDF